MQSQPGQWRPNSSCRNLPPRIFKNAARQNWRPLFGFPVTKYVGRQKLSPQPKKTRGGKIAAVNRVWPAGVEGGRLRLHFHRLTRPARLRPKLMLKQKTSTAEGKRNFWGVPQGGRILAGIFLAGWFHFSLAGHHDSKRRQQATEHKNVHPANLKGPERIDQIDSTMNAHNAHGPPFGPPTTPRAPFLLGRTNPCLPQIVPCCQNSFLAVKNRSLLSNIVPCCQNSILAATFRTEHSTKPQPA